MEPDAVGQRVAQLYRELRLPSAAKLQQVLRKEGIQLPLQGIKDIVDGIGARQIFRPPIQFPGHVTASRLEDRWAADVISFMSNPVTTEEGTFTDVLVIQDIFSRFLNAYAMQSKREVPDKMEYLLKLEERIPRELNTDRGTEFTSARFQAVVQKYGIKHVFKVGHNDLATVDRAIGVLKTKLAIISAEDGTNWLEELQPTVKAMNRLGNKGLLDNAPYDVDDNDELRFRLRQLNAEMAHENAQLAERRRAKLEDKQGFRTLMVNMGVHTTRRAGQPNWSSDVKQVASALGGKVYDTEGREYDTRLVMPVPLDSSAVQAVFGGGNKVRDEKRREATGEFRRDLAKLLGSGDLHMGAAAREMKKNDIFNRTLDELRLTFRGFVDLWEDFEVIGRGPAQRVRVRKHHSTGR